MWKMQRRHSGVCHKFMGPCCLSLSRVSNLEKRSGLCPRQNDHHMNPRGHLGSFPQPDEGLEPWWTPKVQLQHGLTTCCTNTRACLPPQDASTIHTNLKFIWALSDPRRWWISLSLASQAHFLGTLLGQLYRPPKHSQQADKRKP